MRRCKIGVPRRRPAPAARHMCMLNRVAILGLLMLNKRLARDIAGKEHFAFCTMRVLYTGTGNAGSRWIVTGLTDGIASDDRSGARLSAATHVQLAIVSATSSTELVARVRERTTCDWVDTRSSGKGPMVGHVRSSYSACCACTSKQVAGLTVDQAILYNSADTHHRAGASTRHARLQRQRPFSLPKFAVDQRMVAPDCDYAGYCRQLF